MRKRNFGYVLLVITALTVCPLMGYAEEEGVSEEMTGTLKVGDKAPDFTVKDQHGKAFTLSKVLAEKGRVALVFFRSADW